MDLVQLTTGSQIPGDPLQPQAGLLVDTLTDNLTALWNNVWAPFVAQYPGAVILSGFRSVNTDTSQHSTGQAMDIGLPSADAAGLFAAAQWARDALAYDTLVLNWSDSSAIQSWLHCSFTTTNRRRLVQTKDYTDALTPGLTLLRPYTATEHAAATQTLSGELDTLQGFVATQQARQAVFAAPTVQYHARYDSLQPLVAEAIVAALASTDTPPPPILQGAQTYLASRSITAHQLQFQSGISDQHFGFLNETGVPDASGQVSGLEIYQVLDTGSPVWYDQTTANLTVAVGIADPTAGADPTTTGNGSTPKTALSV